MVMMGERERIVYISNHSVSKNLYFTNLGIKDFYIDCSGVYTARLTSGDRSRMVIPT